MAASAATLIREWDLLQQQVVPPLIEVGRHRSPRAWSIGTVEDAAAVAVAYQSQCSESTDRIQVFTDQPEGTREVGFGPSDLRFVPDDSRSSCFVRQDRRYVVDEAIAKRVVLSGPVDPVDLVTVRSSGSGPSGALMGRAVDNLELGGQLLVIEPLARTSVEVPAGLDEVDACSFGRLYRKGDVQAQSAGPWQARQGPDQERPQTLAAQRSQTELIVSHMRLAKSLARRFAHHGEAADDLEQVAMLALLKAARRFDPQRDIRFATFATSTILGELKRHFRDKTWMLRVPRSTQELYLSVKQARDELSHTLSAPPTAKQIAEHLGTSEDAVLQATGAGDNFWPASLNGNTNDDPSTDIPVTDASFEESLARIQVQQLMPRLDHRERLVLKRVYFDGCTQREVSAELQVSQMQVSRVLAGALAKLRD